MQFIDNKHLNGVKQANKHTDKCTILRQISTKYATKSNLSPQIWSIRRETHLAQFIVTVVIAAAITAKSIMTE